MFKLILACILLSLAHSKTLHKRQDTCDPALDLTQVPDNCSQFYRCVGGFFSVATCPGSYQFDASTKKCKPASQVNCVPQGDECTSDQDLTPVDCLSYNRCQNGFLTIESCPDGLVFDSSAKICNSPAEVPECEATTTTTPPPPVVGGECLSADDLTQVPDNCAQFYRCANGYRSTFNCPAGTKFDSNLKVCNWADQVTCVSGSGSGSGSGSTSNTSGSCTSADDLTQVPGNCGAFIRCANGIRYEQSCPGGTLFDSNLKVCNWPNQVTCR
ncbi:unnamed protein product [Brachionus calyciflorus]|uniref:Chitin-binding type-2 domain-containing protein n=1 Tax=Brachionus calyciflorus TaxID=104777 RepID=A0A814AX62_9BILA|nr:unnamed protein product [Brachionus calyciflorus]